MAEEEKQIIYFLKVDPDPQGSYEVDGERFRVREEIDPRYESAHRTHRTTESLLEAFAQRVKSTRNTSHPQRHLEVIQTLEQ